MLLQGFHDLSENGKQGDWCFINEDTYICIKWGSGPDDICVLPIADTEHQKAIWDWDGNREAPTLTGHVGTDSIRVFTAKDITLAHFFMRAGKLVDA